MPLLNGANFPLWLPIESAARAYKARRRVQKSIQKRLLALDILASIDSPSTAEENVDTQQAIVDIGLALRDRSQNIQQEKQNRHTVDFISAQHRDMQSFDGQRVWIMPFQSREIMFRLAWGEHLSRAKGGSRYQSHIGSGSGPPFGMRIHCLLALVVAPNCSGWRWVREWLQTGSIVCAANRG